MKLNNHEVLLLDFISNIYTTHGYEAILYPEVGRTIIDEEESTNRAVVTIDGEEHIFNNIGSKAYTWILENHRA